jgi:hypothetical protein
MVPIDIVEDKKSEEKGENQKKSGEIRHCRLS